MAEKPILEKLDEVSLLDGMMCGCLMSPEPVLSLGREWSP
jgi:hypothetical protein